MTDVVTTSVIASHIHTPATHGSLSCQGERHKPNRPAHFEITRVTMEMTVLMSADMAPARRPVAQRTIAAAVPGMIPIGGLAPPYEPTIPGKPSL